jgi:hypothetical protein
MALERFRVFRLESDTPIYVGTFEGENAKDAVRKAVGADESAGSHVYEAHVLRNTSVFETRSRKETLIDSIQHVNTADHFAVAPAAS